MAFFDLRSTGGTNIMTTFRFEMEVATDSANSRLGLDDKLTAYITTCDLPTSTEETITWRMPGGMANYQAGMRSTKPINVEFVVCSEYVNSWYRVLRKWEAATYNLNTGNNAGKASYCTDAISIRLKSENGQTKYRYHLLRAQVADIDTKSVNSEANELLKVSCTIVYDNYEVYDGNNRLIEQ